MSTYREVLAGQAFYTRRTLAMYDLRVLSISNRFIWRCPTPRLLDLFDRHVSGNHLDVGVGSGYFLDHCRFPIPAPRIALMDLNPQSLAYAAQRIARYRPEIYVANALEPIDAPPPKFDSISVNYLLHCMPGDISAKAVAFDHLAVLANPGAVCFGATLLHAGVTRSAAAKALMAFYNRRGIFSNAADSASAFERALRARFDLISFDIVGCGAVFAGRYRPV